MIVGCYTVLKIELEFSFPAFPYVPCMDRERFCSGVDCLMYDSTVSGLPSESSVSGGPGLLDGEGSGITVVGSGITVVGSGVTVVGSGVTVVGTGVGLEDSGISVSKRGRE